MIVQTILKVFGAGAKTGDVVLKRDMVHQYHFLSSTMRVISWRKHRDASRYEVVTETVAEAFTTMGYLAEDPQECNSYLLLLLIDVRGLVDAVLGAAAKDKSSRIRMQASLALMNLVKAPRSRFTGPQQDNLLYCLLALLDDNKKGVRKYAGATLFNLAISQEYADKIVTHRHGPRRLLVIVGTHLST